MKEIKIFHSKYISLMDSQLVIRESAAHCKCGLILKVALLGKGTDILSAPEECPEALSLKSRACLGKLFRQ